MSSQEVQVFQENGGGLVLADAFKSLVGTEMEDDLQGGISGNYAIVSIRGGKWRIKYQGAEQLVTDANGEPVPSILAVIVKANPFITKQYFKGGYTEGADEAPVCFSTNGTVPSANAPEPQCATCALCEWNKFGSRVTEAGTEVKACQDNKKLAIIPLEDLDNATFGGPMLFRIPASSLKGLSQFGAKMKSLGFPYNAVAVRIGFDTEVSHPKPTFRPFRPLTQEEAEKVLAMYESAAVESVLGGDTGHKASKHAQEPAQDADFEVPQAKPTPAPAATVQPTQVAQPKPRAAAARPKPAPAAATAPAPAAQPPAAAPAKTATFGGGAAKAPVKAPAAAIQPASTPTPAAATEDEAAAAPTGTSLDNDISRILAELNG